MNANAWYITFVSFQIKQWVVKSKIYLRLSISDFSNCYQQEQPGVLDFDEKQSWLFQTQLELIYPNVQGVQSSWWQRREYQTSGGIYGLPSRYTIISNKSSLFIYFENGTGCPKKTFLTLQKGQDRDTGCPKKTFPVC